MAAVPSGDDDLEYEEDDEEEYDEEYEDNNLNTKASLPEPVVDSKKSKPASIIHTTEHPEPKRTPKTHSQTSPTQKQTAAVNVDKYRITQTQNGITNHVVVPPPAAVASSASVPTTTEKIPEGFSGKVEEEQPRQARTSIPTLEPRRYNTRFLPSKHLAEKEHNLKEKPDSYVTVTKSVTGSMDDTQTPAVEQKNFASTYYTKSSTCGYFTFSCNIVYGSNGRSKICRPKAPTNGKC